MRRAYYEQRRALRWLEWMWARVEWAVGQLTTSRYNPLYHLGTLALFLLIVLAFTGTYLTIFYRPGADRAYETVASISATPIGLWMRTVHRYAADALVVVVLLHALKMLLGDRFWDSRWLAWTSGWLLLGIIWLVGVMGYWLVWDRAAQWITEFAVQVFGQSMAVTFFGPQLAAKSFAFFVIVLFLHIFVSVLIILGFLIHILRLSRPRWLAPRWLMLESGIALMILALLRPLPMLEKADFSRLVVDVPIDWLYLAFLPLSTQWGNTLFWGLAFAFFLVAAGLPWLWPGRSAGPARVTEHLCTGCALCALKCPYEAIDIVARSDESGFKSLATIKPNLCVGCGLCIGTCATVGIDLGTTQTHALLDNLRGALVAARVDGEAPVLVVTCQRHVALKSLPTLKESPIAPGVGITTITVDGRETGVVVADFPCAGMVNPEWLRPLLRDADTVRGVALLTCPTDDCSYREGPHWLAQNLKYRRALLAAPLFWLEAVPGEKGHVLAFLRQIVRGEAPETARVAERVRALLEPVHRTWRVAWRPLVTGLAVMMVLVGSSVFVEQPAAGVSVNSGLVRVVLAHPGKVKAVQGALSEEMAAQLPPGVSPEQILGGERYPVLLRVVVDGEVILEREYRPRGLRREGITYAVESLPLSTGDHTVQIFIMDDGETWRLGFEGVLNIEDERVVTLVYDEGSARFLVLSPTPTP